MNIVNLFLFLISVIIGTISVALTLAIIAFIIHLFYILFKSNAKFKKMYIMFTSINIGFLILSLFISFLYWLTIKFSDIPFILTIKIIIGFLYLMLVLWQLVINIYYIGKIQRVSTIKSFFAFLLMYLILIGIGLIFGLKTFIIANYNALI